jgi:hypothetical protein
MKLLKLLAALLFASMSFANAAYAAQTIRFTITGSGNGTLGGIALSGPFTVTGTSEVNDLNGSPNITAYISNDVQLSGAGGTLNAANPMVVFTNTAANLFGLTYFPPPFNVNVFTPFIYMQAPQFGTYDFASNIGPISGTEFAPFGWPARALDTDMGRFDINGPLTNLTFRAELLASGGVPEPASWALMIVGFGAVGAAQRRVRKVRVARA